MILMLSYNIIDKIYFYLNPEKKNTIIILKYIKNKIHSTLFNSSDKVYWKNNVEWLKILINILQSTDKFLSI